MTLSEEFLAKGIVKIPVEDRLFLDQMAFLANNIFVTELGSMILPPTMGTGFLNQTHNMLDVKELNKFRIKAIERLNDRELNYHESYFSLAKSALHELVGNELVMQRNINLSIQLPGDDSSLLPIHCDTWSGDSPYEVVLWVPLVDCYGTKSMFFIDKEKDAEIQPRIKDYKNSEELWKEVEKHATFIDVKYGECLLFTQNIMHGNRVNETNETRWSLNCRFKSLFSPYADKKLGEFFEPVEIRPATCLGMSYEYPKI